MPLKYMLLVSSLLASNVALAHARLKPGSATPPRNESTGLKSVPCGGVARSATPKAYKGGQDLTIEWEETINHPGYFTLKMAKANDANFDEFVLAAKVVDTKNTSISGPSDYHQYSATVKLPNITCDACTIQLVQVMEENPKSPNFYYSCSDIKLTATPTTTPSPPTPPPTPAPVTPAPVTPAPVSPAPAPVPEVTPAPAPAPNPSKKPSKPQGLQVEKN